MLWRDPLAALMPATRSRLLTVLLMHDGRWWFLSELSRELGTAASSLQRELAALTEAEILRRRRDGARVYYRANVDHPLFADLRGLVAKTHGLVDRLAEALAPVADRIDVAWVYGSMARGDSDAVSDIDLMIVGDIGLPELLPFIGGSALDLGRVVNPIVYSVPEFVAGLATGSGFLGNVVEEPKLFVVGSERELERVASAAARPDPAPGRERDRSTSPGGRA